MKKIIPLLFLLVISCGKKENIEVLHLDSAITKPGIYNSASLKIVVRSFDNGALTFAVADGKGQKLLYQHNILHSFSNYQFWILYPDAAKNIWFYNADLGEYYVLKWSDESQSYTITYNPAKPCPLKFKAILKENNVVLDKKGIAGICNNAG